MQYKLNLKRRYSQLKRLLKKTATKVKALAFKKGGLK